MSLARKDGKYAPLPHFTHTRSNGSNTCQTRANLMFIPIVYPPLSVPPRLAIGNEVIAVLSVSPLQHDHDTLASLLGRDQWRIHNALSLRSASVFTLETDEHSLQQGRPLAYEKHICWKLKRFRHGSGSRFAF